MELMRGLRFGSAQGWSFRKAYPWLLRTSDTMHPTSAGTSKTRLRWGNRIALDEGQGLELGDLEAFAAADVAAGYHVVAADHVGLGFGESGPVAFVGVAGDLRLFAADYPTDLVVAGLAAVGANQGMGALLICFGEKIALFQHSGEPQLSSRTKVFHTRECYDETKS